MTIKRIAFLFWAVVAAQSAFAQTAKHVVLISIDGLRPEMYRDPNWKASNLQRLMGKGSYADHLLSVFPSYTYPSHTAMLTGAYPARSGIHFNQLSPSSADWNWFMKDIKVPTLWQALKKLGMSTAAVEWPVSVGPEITWNVPEIWSDANPDRITVSRKYATPGLIEEIEQNATGKLDSHNMAEDAASMDYNSADMAAYIFKTKRPALLAVHFAGVDNAAHDDGRDSPRVREAFQVADNCVGKILEEIEKSPMKDSTVVIVVGDHGFSDIHEVMRPNMLIKALPARFVASGGSCFLYPFGTVTKNELPALLTAVKDSLNKLPDSLRGKFRIIEQKELDLMGADSAAVLTLSAKPGLIFSGATRSSEPVNHGPGTTNAQSQYEGLFVPAHGGHHGYDPNIPEMYTGFIAAGTAINKGGHVKELREVDIAPLIAKLLGIEFKTPDGRLREGILTK